MILKNKPSVSTIVFAGLCQHSKLYEYRLSADANCMVAYMLLRIVSVTYTAIKRVKLSIMYSRGLHNPKTVTFTEAKDWLEATASQNAVEHSAENSSSSHSDLIYRTNGSCIRSALIDVWVDWFRWNAVGWAWARSERVVYRPGREFLKLASTFLCVNIYAAVFCLSCYALYSEHI